MPESRLSRRELLKVLAAAAGTAALSSVPNNWRTPVVDVGMLPAHAARLSGLGAIQVTIIDHTAPIRNSNAPTIPCFADVTIAALALEHCFSAAGSFTFPGIVPGDYTVHCVGSPCVNDGNPDLTAHVVAGGTASLSFTIGGTCPG